MTYRPNILALDLSISATGIAFPDGTTDLIPTSTEDDDDTRVDQITEAVEAALLGAVDLVVIEAGVYRSQAAFRLGMLHRSIRQAVRAAGLRYALPSPGPVKKYATGKGTATKADMRMALYKRAGIDDRDDNRVDAWWLRAIALEHYGHPVVEVPASHRASAEAVDWPDLADIT